MHLIEDLVQVNTLKKLIITKIKIYKILFVEINESLVEELKLNPVTSKQNILVLFLTKFVIKLIQNKQQQKEIKKIIKLLNQDLDFIKSMADCVKRYRKIKTILHINFLDQQLKDFRFRINNLSYKIICFHLNKNSRQI